MCRHCHSVSTPAPPSILSTLISATVPLSVVAVVIILWKLLSAVTLLIVLLLLSSLLLFNSLRLNSKQLPLLEKNALYQHESSVAARSRFFSQKHDLASSLSAAIQLATISYDSSSTEKVNGDLLKKLHALLALKFPRVHQRAKLTVVADYSLVFELQGSDSSYLPILLMGHLDVVPVLDPAAWKHAPFDGDIDDGYVWGRGALDCKATVISVLAAMEDLLARDQSLKRSVFIAFGHDEEIGGSRGAKAIATLFEERRLKFACIIDEGTGLMNKALPGLNVPLAMVGVCEKGYVDVEATVTLDTTLVGHASMPPRVNAIAILGRAMYRLDKYRTPLYLSGTVRDMFEIAAPHLPFFLRLMFGNLWLFGGVLKQLLSRKPGTAALLQTTTAVTLFHAGTKSNVLAKQAVAIINHRLHPTDSIPGVLHYNRSVIQDDRVSVKVRDGFDPLEASPVTRHDTLIFQSIRRAIATLDPSAIVVPSLMMGNTDTRWYWKVSSNIFRFMPMRLSVDEVSMIHGDNERFGVDNLAEMALFYQTFVLLMDAHPEAGLKV